MTGLLLLSCNSNTNIMDDNQFKKVCRPVNYKHSEHCFSTIMTNNKEKTDHNPKTLMAFFWLIFNENTLHGNIKLTVFRVIFLSMLLLPYSYWVRWSTSICCRSWSQVWTRIIRLLDQERNCLVIKFSSMIWFVHCYVFIFFVRKTYFFNVFI